MIVWQRFWKLGIVILLIALALGERVLFDLGPNVELLTVTTFLAAVYLGFPYSLLVPLTALLISDFILGNSRIFVFTWSAYLLIGLVTLILSRWRGHTAKLVFAATTGSFLSSLFFFVWTNFGVWLQGWYARDWAGLVRCYYLALPFFRNNLFSNLLFVPLGFGIVEMIRALSASWRLRSSRAIEV